MCVCVCVGGGGDGVNSKEVYLERKTKFWKSEEFAGNRETCSNEVKIWGLSEIFWESHTKKSRWYFRFSEGTVALLTAVTSLPHPVTFTYFMKHSKCRTITSWYATCCISSRFSFTIPRTKIRRQQDSTDQCYFFNVRMLKLQELSDINLLQNVL